jgi:glycerol-3-phosphate acyltransferase PlsX
MSKKLIISIDAMGGDHGPEIVIPGIDLALERTPELEVLLFGNGCCLLADKTL